MKPLTRYILTALILTTNICAYTQSSENEKYAIKASAEFGLGNSISTSSDMSTLSTKSTMGNYGVDFGWTFWKKQNNRLELNVGLAYSPTSVTLDLGSFDYDYSAPADADMDGDTYQRYYEIGFMNQKVGYGRLTLPVYLTYAYRCNEWFGVHADLGLRFGFKTNSKLSKVVGEAYSYGIYPQYDNLLIDESYLNDFGKTDLAKARYVAPECSGFSTSLLVGFGAEFRIYGPLAADISLRYNAGFSNLFKGRYDGQKFNSENAPVNYSVSEGQAVKSLTDYLNSSKVSQIALRISLIYRF